VLTAIDLDDQSRLMAGEVRYEPADRHPTAKSVALGLAGSQHLPELLLRLNLNPAVERRISV
jgi:hypothetical protein